MGVIQGGKMGLVIHAITRQACYFVLISLMVSKLMHSPSHTKYNDPVVENVYIDHDAEKLYKEHFYFLFI